MKRLLPWLILPWLTLAQADETQSQKSLLNQVSEEAAQTSLDNIKANNGDTSAETAITSSSDVDLDQLTQSVASRLSALLGTKTRSGNEERTLNLETVVSDALHDGKQMVEIRAAVAQAMSDVTGQSGMLNTGNPITDTATNSDKMSLDSKALAKQASQGSDDGQTQGDNSENLNSPDSQSVESTLPTTATVLPGESLFTLAQRIYGQENGRRFLDIYAANRDIIKDINVVIEGQVLKLPPPKVQVEP